MSLDALRGSLRGIDGVRSRIAELERRSEASGEFAEKLDASKRSPMPGALAGEITPNGTVPMNPFGGLTTSTMGGTQLRAMADSVARREGVDPKLLAALVDAESGWDPLARSNKGAQGLTQLMPETAQKLGVGSPLDPEQNLIGGARYLRQMLDHFGGDVPRALAAYNAGPGAVERAGGVPNYPETQAYVRRILGAMGGR